MDRRAYWIDVFLLVIALTFEFQVLAEEDAVPLHLKFEYKYSFKGPHLIQADETIPFWTQLGDTVAGNDQVRLVPSIRDKRGLVWSNYPFPHDAWEVEVHVRIDGRGKVGADGMAIWYTADQAELGPVYGSRDYYNGVGIFLDSFDNDNRLNNPMIMVVANDGTQQFSHQTDGVGQLSGSCFKDFRSRPYPVKIKLQYRKGTLRVLYNTGNLPDDNEFELCTFVENITLPNNYYFGVSAATGGLADDHDVLKFLTKSVWEKQPERNETVDEQQEDQKKLQDDYEKNLEDFNKMEEEYKKQHPDAVQEQQRPEELYEGAATQELRSIFEVQSSIKKDIRRLSENLDRVLDHQSFMFQRFDAVEGKVSRTGGQGAPPPGADDFVKTYHIDNVLNMQRETYDAVKQIRDSFKNLENLVGNMDVRVQQQLQRNPTGGGGDSYEAIQHRQDIQERIHTLQSDLASLLQRQPNTPKLICPEPEMPSCISIGLFVLIAAAQVIILLIYHSMKASREDAAKKFF